MKREFEVGDRVAVKMNGEIIGRGLLKSIPSSPRGCVRVQLDDGRRIVCYSENLRHVKPKKERQGWWMHGILFKSELIHDTSLKELFENPVSTYIRLTRPDNIRDWIYFKEVKVK